MLAPPVVEGIIAGRAHRPPLGEFSPDPSPRGLVTQRIVGTIPPGPRGPVAGAVQLGVQKDLTRIGGGSICRGGSTDFSRPGSGGKPRSMRSRRESASGGKLNHAGGRAGSSRSLCRQESAAGSLPSTSSTGGNYDSWFDLPLRHPVQGAFNPGYSGYSFDAYVGLGPNFDRQLCDGNPYLGCSNAGNSTVELKTSTAVLNNSPKEITDLMPV